MNKFDITWLYNMLSKWSNKENDRVHRSARVTRCNDTSNILSSVIFCFFRWADDAACASNNLGKWSVKLGWGWAKCRPQFIFFEPAWSMGWSRLQYWPCFNRERVRGWHALIFATYFLNRTSCQNILPEFAAGLSLPLPNSLAFSRGLLIFRRNFQIFFSFICFSL